MTETTEQVSLDSVTPLQLDWLVALTINAPTYGPADFREQRKWRHDYRWSESWLVGGPLIAGEGISILWRPLIGKWWACAGKEDPMDECTIGQMGATQLEAAMKALVSAHIGDWHYLPPELL